MTKESSYLNHLERALRRRGLDASHTAEVIQEVTNHLTESGDHHGRPSANRSTTLRRSSPQTNPKATPSRATRRARRTTRCATSPNTCP